MLLIHPPIAKPCEPPAGVARLSGALAAHGISHYVVDTNIEGLLSLLKRPRMASDTWSHRAIKHLSENIAALRDIRTYQSFGHYSQAVRDLNRVIAMFTKDKGIIMGLTDYHHKRLSPARSADLIFAAEHPEINPFYDYFKRRIPEIIEAALVPQNYQKQKGLTEVSGYEEERSRPVIGFSLNYLSQAICTFAMIGFMKREFRDIKIVIGGSLVSSWMARPGWKNPFVGLVDHMIAGPGERPLLDLLRASQSGKMYSEPDYSTMPFHDYLSPGLILPYSGASGCYWHQCSFCPETAEENSYIPIPAQQAMQDLSALVHKTSPILLHFLDCAINPAFMYALVDKPLGVPWYGFARISKDFLDTDFCMQLKQSGCVMLMLGLESGDQGVLDKMRKGIDLTMASRVLRNLHKAGIAIYVYLLFGTPPETIIEARRTLDFVVQHSNAISFLNLAIFNMPLCGSNVKDFATEQFYEGDLSLYTSFKHPLGWDRKLVRFFLENEFRRHPIVSSILKTEPPYFTSNHAALFTR